MPDEQEFETAMFSSVPDISVMSTNGSVLPAFYTPTPRNGTHRTVSRPASLPEVVFCTNTAKCGVIATNPPVPASRAPRGVCPCMLATRP
ncbi:hypothetical protein BD309DRAFT_948612 [Dichomitus squalens]|uniref:Uncharacterized protein n=1 Tax=Dichomitus squalens TaxID=114155 RepID=A0A4Q9P7U1_9APHY|nr:hypothetical protein BD309DRAFT_948612 [Dichomitus squalens]TBU58033.1 hypothetical protein BD310DRAFT_928158 [Dichomitus squalens]